MFDTLRKCWKRAMRERTYRRLLIKRYELQTLRARERKETTIQITTDIDYVTREIDKLVSETIRRNEECEEQ